MTLTSPSLLAMSDQRSRESSKAMRNRCYLIHVQIADLHHSPILMTLKITHLPPSPAIYWQSPWCATIFDFCSFLFTLWHVTLSIIFGVSSDIPPTTLCISVTFFIMSIEDKPHTLAFTTCLTFADGLSQPQLLTYQMCLQIVHRWLV